MGSRVTDRAEWCAAVRAARGEEIRASAPVTISTWLLVEHPGPWPSRDLPGDIGPVALGVLAAAEDRGVRVQLIRRVRDRRRSSREIVVAGRGGERGWAERREIGSLDELSALDLDALGAGTPPGFGEPVDAAEPVVLVCTHGRRDVCCARLGRPVAVELDRMLPGQVWETTHIGGDRFAANVVTLPGGHYHGGLTASDAGRMADAIRAGEVVLDRWRGECGVDAAEQAAVHVVQQHLRDARVGAARALPGAALEGTQFEGTQFEGTQLVVRVTAGAAGDFTVALRPVVGEERKTSCADGGTIGAPAGYELVSLAPSSGSSGTTMGEPVTGSGMVMQSMPNTADTVPGVITSAGVPEA